MSLVSSLVALLSLLLSSFSSYFTGSIDLSSQAEKEKKEVDLKEIPTIEDVMFEEQDKAGKKGILKTLFSTSWIWK